MTVNFEIKSSNMLSMEELKECVALLEQYFELPHLSQDQLNSISMARTLWFITKNNDTIIGIATLTPDKEDNLKNILVIPSYRNKGICSMMLNNIKEFYVKYKNKLHTPNLTVLKNKENTHSLIQLYKKNNFFIEKETYDKIFMTLII
jgi:ribosomal protein S18 acetylase RimI-like enzyme